MERKIILVHENGLITIPNSDVWMTEIEIADMFHVTVRAVNAGIKGVLKSGILKEYDCLRYIRFENGSGVDAYNVEMIFAMAFRINSFPAKSFREWLKKGECP